MKTRLKMALGVAAIVLLALIGAVVLHRTALGFLQIWEVLLSIVLVCAAVALIASNFLKRQKSEQPPAVGTSHATIEPSSTHTGQIVENVGAVSAADAKIQEKRSELEIRPERGQASSPAKIEELEAKVGELKILETELRKGIEFLTSSIDNAAIFFAVIDASGKTVMMNRRMSRSLGYSEDEIVAADFVDSFIPARLRQEAWPDLMKNFQGNRDRIRMEGFALSKDGTEIPTEWIVMPYLDATTQLSHCLVVGIDVTQHTKSDEKAKDDERAFEARLKKASVEARYYRLLLDSSPDPILVYDVEAKPTYSNPAFTRTFGWSTEDLGEAQTIFVPDSQRKIEKTWMDGLVPGGGVLKDFDTQRLSKEGRAVSIKLTAALVRDQTADPAGIILVLREIPEEKKVEEQTQLVSEQPKLQKRQIKTKEIVNDIKSGATDSEIRAKYGLTVNDLHTLFRKLLSLKAVTSEEIHDRASSRKALKPTVAGDVLPEGTTETAKQDGSQKTTGDAQPGKVEPPPIQPPVEAPVDDTSLKLFPAPVVQQDDEKPSEPKADVGDRDDETKKVEAHQNGPLEPSPTPAQAPSISAGTTVFDIAGDSLTERRLVRARELLADVQAGVGDTLLMEKYRLSAEQLNKVLRKLLDADLITHMQLFERTSLSDTQVTKAFVETGRAIEELN